MMTTLTTAWQEDPRRAKSLLVGGGIFCFVLIVTLLTLQQSLWVIAGVVALWIVAALLAWPEVATLLVFFILYTNAGANAVEFHGVPYIVGASFPALLLLPLTSYLVVRRTSLIIDTPFLVLVFFWSIQLTGLLFVERIDRLSGAIGRVLDFLVEGVFIYFLVINVVRDRRTLRYAVWTLVFAGLLMGGLSFYQQITGTFDSNYGGFAQMSNTAFGTGEETLQGEVEQPRLAGPVGEQNRYAQVMLMLVPLALFRMWGERSLFLRILGGAGALFALIGMGLTFSRGALFGLALMLLVMVILRYVKWYQIAIIGLVLLGLMQAVPNIGGRLVKLENLSLTAMFQDDVQSGLEGTDGSTQNRVAQQFTALSMFLDHPLLGVGTGFYRVYYHEYAKQVGMGVRSEERESHTLYLGMAAENGILGVGSFLFFIFLLMRNLTQVRKQWFELDRPLANLAISFFLAIIGFLGTSIFLHLAFARFFFLIVGLAGATYQISQQTPLRVESKG
ncbi:MAG: O-antigen ligase family protein [Caldilineaceae bacterium]|nr:O-antigen ligase family protein [Caldilineaceae bacterium]